MALEEAQLLHDLAFVELTGNVAGAFCAKALADTGARVIKVEPPRGHPQRSDSAPEPGDTETSRSIFEWLNTGKESVAIDTRHPDGVALLGRLLENADGAIVDERTQELYALPDVATLAEQHPHLVVAALSPFGATGPHADWLSDDIIQYAMTCWMHMTGTPDREPLASGGDLANTIPGLAAASGVLMAIHERKSSGKGQVVDIAQQDVLALFQPYTSLSYSYTGMERARTGMPFPMTIVPAADGYLGINVLTQVQWETLCAFAGMVDLLEDPEYADPLARAAHAQELTDRFAAWAADKTRAEIVEEAQGWRIPLGYVPTPDETRNLKQHEARDFFQTVRSSDGAELMMPGVPFRIHEPIRVRRAPAVNEQGDAIARDLDERHGS